MSDITSAHPGLENRSAATEFAIRMENITRRFPGVVANRGVHLQVRSGSFHAIIGENGAGKSTLLNILYGRLRPDTGRIFLHNEEVTEILHSPADAIRRGVGLVSQHYSLIPALSLLDNVMLGAEPTFPGGILKRSEAERRVEELADSLGLGNLDFHIRAEKLSVAAQQKVEILKALYRGANILLLDEPTATLAPQEADALFALLRSLSEQGATIVFVTHKLREVMTHSHAVSILRGGRNVGDFVTRETEEMMLLHRMIGARSSSPSTFRLPLSGELEPESPPSLPAPVTSSPYAVRTPSTSPLFQIENVSARNQRGARAVQSVSLEVNVGEIVGVAGVDGSGQRELTEALIGLRRLEEGRLFLAGIELTRLSVRQRQQKGLRYIPEDRHRAGLILDFDIAENYLLGHELSLGWGGGALLDLGTIYRRAEDMIRRYDVRVGFGGVPTPAQALSGGNQQKVVVARAMESKPRFLVACQPTRGLDVEASHFVYRTLLKAREQGMGVLLFSLDLDEIFKISDRIAVMFNGKLAGVLPRAAATPENVGALMTGSALTGAENALLTADTLHREEADSGPTEAAP